jgi:hypothetical protein
MYGCLGAFGKEKGEILINFLLKRKLHKSSFYRRKKGKKGD